MNACPPQRGPILTMTDLLSEDYSEIEQRRLTTIWQSRSRDTSRDIAHRRLAAAWSTPAWRKLQMALEMSQTALNLAQAGVRHRHPDASEDEIRYRLACLLFGTRKADLLCSPRTQEESRHNA